MVSILIHDEDNWSELSDDFSCCVDNLQGIEFMIINACNIDLSVGNDECDFCITSEDATISSPIN